MCDSTEVMLRYGGDGQLYWWFFALHLFSDLVISTILPVIGAHPACEVLQLFQEQDGSKDPLCRVHGDHRYIVPRRLFLGTVASIDVG